MAAGAVPATVITRRQSPVTYAAGAKQIVQLSKGLCWRGIKLRLTGQLTCTGANNTAANTALGDEWACISKIELIINGTTVLFSYAGSDLKSVARVLSGWQPQVSVGMGDGATANPSFDSTIWIPFLNPRSRRQFDTLLYTGEMNDVRLEVTWAASYTSVNSAATGWATNPYVEVYTREQTLPTDPKTGNAMLPNFYRRTLKIPVQIAASTSAFRYQLPTGPIYRGLLLAELNNTPAESHSLLTNVKVYSGPTTFMDESAASIYATQIQGAKVPSLIYPTSAGIMFQGTGQVSSAADPKSWRWVDFCEDGYMSEAIDTDSIGDTFIEFAFGGAGTVNIFTQELIRINRAGVGNVSTAA